MRELPILPLITDNDDETIGLIGNVQLRTALIYSELQSPIRVARFFGHDEGYIVNRALSRIMSLANLTNVDKISTWCKDNQIDRVVAMMDATKDAENGELNYREILVSLLVANGLTNEEIGERLYSSPQTIKNHITSALAKTDTTNRTQLARWVLAFYLD